MLDVKGFRGFCFDRNKLGALDDIITPPYDVITPAERAGLVQRNPHTMARLILPEEEGGLSRYEVAARDFEAWIAAGILRQDEADSMYLLRQTFHDPEGRECVRKGFLAVAKLPEPGESYVLGHERTFNTTFEDRFCLMQTTRAQLGPVFVLYSDPRRALAPFFVPMSERPCDMAADTIDGVRQEVWKVAPSAEAADFLRPQVLYIADGHHRFRTAGAYRDLMREKERPNGLRPYDYVLMGFVALEDPGLFVYPTHRLMKAPEGFEPLAFLRGLERWFSVSPVDGRLEALVSAQHGCAMGVCIAGAGQHLLVLKDLDRLGLLGADHKPAWRDLDVAVLHRGIVERVMGLGHDTPFTYERSAERALASVARGEHDLAFILKATRSDQIRACAEAQEPMPHKSTYFFPKLPSGAVIHRLVS